MDSKHRLDYYDILTDLGAVAAELREAEGLIKLHQDVAFGVVALVPAAPAETRISEPVASHAFALFVHIFRLGYR